MNDKQKRPVIRQDRSVFQDIALQIRLIFRLLGDPRVSPLLKLLPLGTLIYFIFPDIAPGPFDDALVFGIGTYIFIELCPPGIVAEHREALEKEISGTWKPPQNEDVQINEEDIIEGEYREQ